MIVTTEPGQSTSEQTWAELALEIFPFELQDAWPTLDEDALLPTRFHVSQLYDTKVNNLHPPKTTVRLDQHATGGATTLRIGAGARKRVWRLRVHLLPGETLASELGFAVVARHAENSNALVPESVAVPGSVDSGAVMEAVVESSAGQEHTIQFEVSRRL